MATILGIESTCDETAAAVVLDGWDVRSSPVASQAELHAKYRGVVPEIASRAHIENLLPVLREAVRTALGTLRLIPSPRPELAKGTPGGEGQGELDRLDAIAVAYRPGLIGSL